jgi:hypothetical protein
MDRCDRDEIEARDLSASPESGVHDSGDQWLGRAAQRYLDA